LQDLLPTELIYPNLNILKPTHIHVALSQSPFDRLLLKLKCFSKWAIKTRDIIAIKSHQAKGQTMARGQRRLLLLLL